MLPLKNPPAAMDTIRAAGLAARVLGIPIYSDVHAATQTNGGLLTSVAPPPNSRPLDRQSLLAGGEQRLTARDVSYWRPHGRASCLNWNPTALPDGA